MCVKGSTGPLCQYAEVSPSIDRRFISESGTTNGVEGQPYIVSLPVVPSAVMQCLTDAEGLRLDESRSILVWSSPIGRSSPYNVTVLVSTIAGESSFSWKLNVPSTYSAVVDKVEQINGTRRYRIEGRVVGTTKRKDVPVLVILSGAKSKKREIVEVTANAMGKFVIEWTPPGTSDDYDVVATHPGEENTGSTHGISLRVTSDSVEYTKNLTEEQLRRPVIYTIHSGGEVKGNWDAELFYPTDQVEIENVDKSGDRVSVKYRVRKALKGPLVVLLKNGDHKITASHQVNIAAQPSERFSSSPNKIMFYLNDHTIHEPIQLKLFTGSREFTSPLSLKFSSEVAPFFILSSSPPLEEYEQYSNREDPITIWMQSTGEGTSNGTMTVNYRTDAIYQIPYSIIRAPPSFTLDICLRDDQYLPPNGVSTSTDAEITLTRTSNNAVIVRQSTVNGPEERIEVVPGMYQLRVTSEHHEDYNELIFLSPSNMSFCVQLKPIRRDVLPVWNSQQLTVAKTSASEAQLPILTFSPSALSPGEHEVEVEVSAPNGTVVVLLPLDSNHLRLIVPETTSSNGDSLRMRAIVDTDQWEFPLCDAILVPIPFLHHINGLSFTGEAHIIVMRDTNELEEHPHLCGVGSSSPLSLSHQTDVLCNCASGARAKCREKYRGAAACGRTWRRIPDDTVSIEVLALFLSLISDCRSLDIELDQVYEATKCISALESVCPLNRRVAVLPVQGSPIGAIDSMTAPVNVLLPVLRALDLQSIALSTLYNEFFRTLEVVFPPSNYSTLDDAAFEKFFKAIGDESEQGKIISSTESTGIGASDLVKRWNTAVEEWTSGKIRPFEFGESDTIDFSSAKQMIVAADRLKSLARQQGSANPFTLLHEYVGRVLSSAGEDTGMKCAEAYVHVSSSAVEEDQQFTIRVDVKNSRMDSALDNVELTLDLVRDDPYQVPLRFRIGPFVYTGMRSLGGMAALGPGQSFQATWTILSVADSRLSRDAHYQAIVTLSFLNSGGSTLMRLNSPRITVQPRLSMKALYFIRSPRSENVPFDFMAALVNTGYRPIEDINIESAQLTAVDNLGSPLPFAVSSVILSESTSSIPQQSPHQETRTSIVGPLPPIQTTTSSLIHVNVTMNDDGRLTNALLIPTVNGKYLKVEDSRIFTVHSISSSDDRQKNEEGLIVSPFGLTSPTFYYTLRNAKLQTIANLKLLQSRWESATSDEKEYIRVMAAMTNTESPDYASTLWGKVELPQLPSNYRLLKIREVGGGGGANGRGVEGGRWIENKDGKQTLNFIDNGAISRGGNINYEFIFGDPKDFEQPIFGQDLYRIQILPEFWPQEGSVVGEVTAQSPLGKEIKYNIYSQTNDDTWAVVPSTGQIVLQHPIRQGEEKCYTLVAQDEDGATSKVAVAINTGTAPHPCTAINDLSGLTPLIWTSETTINPTTNIYPETETTEEGGLITTRSPPSTEESTQVTNEVETTEQPTEGTTEEGIQTTPQRTEGTTEENEETTTEMETTQHTIDETTTMQPVETTTDEEIVPTVIVTSDRTLEPLTTTEEIFTTHITSTDESPLTLVPTTSEILTTYITSTDESPITPMATTPEIFTTYSTSTDETLITLTTTPEILSTYITSTDESPMTVVTRPTDSEVWTTMETIETTEGPTTTEEFINTMTPDEQLTSEWTTINPWATGSSRDTEIPQSTTTKYYPTPPPISTSEYEEYTTESIETTTEPEEETTIWEHSSEGTLPTITPFTVGTTTQFIPTDFPHPPTDLPSIYPDSTLVTLPEWTPTGSTPPVPFSTTQSFPSSDGGTGGTWTDEPPFTLITRPTDSSVHPTTSFPGTGVGREACRLKGTAAIWDVICDLSKTVSHKRM